jgi:hypothetical protein
MQKLNWENCAVMLLLALSGGKPPPHVQRVITPAHPAWMM